MVLFRSISENVEQRKRNKNRIDRIKQTRILDNKLSATRRADFLAQKERTRRADQYQQRDHDIHEQHEAANLIKEMVDKRSQDLLISDAYRHAQMANQRNVFEKQNREIIARESAKISRTRGLLGAQKIKESGSLDIERKQRLMLEKARKNEIDSDKKKVSRQRRENYSRANCQSGIRLLRRKPTPSMTNVDFSSKNFHKIINQYTTNLDLSVNDVDLSGEVNYVQWFRENITPFLFKASVKDKHGNEFINQRDTHDIKAYDVKGDHSNKLPKSDSRDDYQNNKFVLNLISSPSQKDTHVTPDNIPLEVGSSGNCVPESIVAGKTAANCMTNTHCSSAGIELESLESLQPLSPIRSINTDIIGIVRGNCFTNSGQGRSNSPIDRLGCNIETGMSLTEHKGNNYNQLKNKNNVSGSGQRAGLPVLRTQEKLDRLNIVLSNWILAMKPTMLSLEKQSDDMNELANDVENILSPSPHYSSFLQSNSDDWPSGNRDDNDFLESSASLAPSDEDNNVGV